VPTYVALMKITDQGIKEIKDAPKRIQDGVKGVGGLGGQLKAMYAVFGEYDYVGIAEFPNDDAAMCFALALSSQGFIRSTILKAFNVDEFTKICKMLP
jgi:uncharacterized protein with GYD domain